MSGEAQTPNYADFLSLEARTRARSGIKQLRPYFEIPGMISVSWGWAGSASQQEQALTPSSAADTRTRAPGP